MLAYLASKKQFLQDAPTIEDVVAMAVKENLNINVGYAELQSWKNSLGNAMSHVMHDPLIPDDVAVAVEYRLNGRRFRLDFVIAGENEDGKESVVIIELKQWTEVEFSDLPNHVFTFVGKGKQHVLHPSYQANSYARHLQDFNEYVYGTGVVVNSCAYLHNCVTPEIIFDDRYQEELANSPVFVKGDVVGVQEMIRDHVVSGTGTEIMRRIDGAPVRPSKQLADAALSMLKGNEEFVLVDDQKTIFESIIATATKSKIENKQVMIIKGGPGTGKSVIAINALAKLTGGQMNARYVTANSAPREVFKTKFKGAKGITVKDLMSGSGGFDGVDIDAFDVLIVDEAHRLKIRDQYSKTGTHQIRDIIDSARTVVFFVDEAQKVTWKDIGEIDTIRNFAHSAGAQVSEFELKSQFRCSGSDDYMVWIDDALGIRLDDQSYFSPDTFDFRVIDNPNQLREMINEKNAVNNKSRIVAGYCWDWVSKRSPTKADLVFPEFGFQATWNLFEDGQGWIVQPDSNKQIGCIHTCQGLELDYVGVIVGPDLVVREGELVTVPTARAKTDTSLNGYKKERKENPAAADAKASEIIRNTYRTLMSRGMKGCYVYFTDAEAAKYFKDRLPK